MLLPKVRKEKLFQRFSVTKKISDLEIPSQSTFTRTIVRVAQSRKWKKKIISLQHIETTS